MCCVDPLNPHGEAASPVDHTGNAVVTPPSSGITLPAIDAKGGETEAACTRLFLLIGISF